MTRKTNVEENMDKKVAEEEKKQKDIRREMSEEVKEIVNVIVLNWDG